MSPLSLEDGLFCAGSPLKSLTLAARFQGCIWAAESVALQRSSMAARLPPMRTAATGLSGMAPNSLPQQLFCSTTRATIFSNVTLHYTAYDPSRLAWFHDLPAALHRQGPIAGYNACCSKGHQLTTSLQEDRCVIVASSLSQCMHARA